MICLIYNEFSKDFSGFYGKIYIISVRVHINTLLALESHVRAFLNRQGTEAL